MPLFYILLTLIVVIEIWLIFSINEVRKSKNWEITEGEILSSEIETLQVTNESSVNYKAGISYKYTISGKQYISRRIFFGDKVFTDFNGSSLKLINKYKIGSKVDVYYNPKNIEESVLERRAAPYIIILFIIGIIVILLTITIIQYYPEVVAQIS